MKITTNLCDGEPPSAAGHDLARELVPKADVRSTYDARGNLRSVVATLPRDEFERVHHPSTRASVFIDGHWLLFGRLESDVGLDDRRRTLVVWARSSGVRLEVGVERLFPGAAFLNFIHEGRRVLRMRSPVDAECDEFVYEAILAGGDALERVAGGARRAFADVDEKLKARACRRTPARLAVQVLPAHPEDEAAVEIGFNRNAVHLH